MPLTLDEVQSRLLDGDRANRDVALNYFYDGVPSLCETTVATALQAVERYGWWQAFSHPTAIARLRQDENSIRWFVAHADVWTAAPPEGSLAAELTRGFGDADSAIRVAVDLARVDVDLLRRFEKELGSLPHVDAGIRATMEERLRLAAADPETLWAELCCKCVENQHAWIDGHWERIELLEEALGRHRERFRDRVLGVLAKTDADSPLWDWLAARLAGTMRLHEAAPILVDMLLEVDEDQYDLAEELEAALSSVGGDDVVPILVEKYASATHEFRMSTAVIFERLRSPTATSAALDLAAREVDDDLRYWLLRAPLSALDERSVEPTRRDLLSRPKGEDHIELRSRLLEVCRFLEKTFPEYDAWVQDAKYDRDYLRADRAAHFAANRILAEYRNSTFDDNAVELDDEYEAVPRLQAVVNTGRNDLCPCGSGKKYKKCCLRMLRSG